MIDRVAIADGGRFSAESMSVLNEERWWFFCGRMFRIRYNNGGAFHFLRFSGTEHMGYILKNQSSTASGARRFAAFVAFAGLVFTIAQIGYISRTGNALCLNSGCLVVENLIRLPPVFFNLAGAFFFLIIFVFTQLAKRNYGGDGFPSRAAGTLLFLAMAAEGVLLSFQMQVSRAWCSYCLVIFACVFLLNLSFGWRQFIRGLAALVAVVAASASLNYTSPPDMSDSGRGSYGELVRPNAAIHMRLYFSAACPHCEEVIASLDKDFSCQIGFYPLDKAPEPRLDGLRPNPHYDTAINHALLQGLGLYEVPVLMAREENETRIITGKDAILAFLQRCRPAPVSPEGQSAAPNKPASVMPPAVGDDSEESCQIGTSCPSAANPR
jgi:hypothetical protein